MNMLKIGFILCIVNIALSCNTPRQVAVNNKEKVTQYVNTFIGSAPLLDPKVIGYTPPPNWRVWAGLTYPGSALPNAMVQLSPITEYGTGAGYEYEDTVIHGFTHTNKGHWNLCNIPILPVTGDPNADGRYSSVFSHAKESAGAGFYNVFLEDYQIEVNLTSTLHCGFHRYIYSSADDRKIVFDLSRANNKVLSWDIERVGNNAIEGFQQVHENTIYFFAYITDEIESLQETGNHKEEGLAIIKLKKGNNKTVELKIGLSYVSTQNARQNLESEIGNTSFEAIRSKADSTWEESLSKIELKGGTQKQRQMFYSSLYRSLLWPALKSDVNGEYTDVNHQTAKAGFNYYAVPSLWDTYRNKLVLLGIMSPKVTGDVIQSMKDIGDKTGFIPTFFHGDHAAPFIAGSYLRGIDGYDVKSTYQLLLRNANIEGPSRPHLNEYLQKGFISDPDIANPHVETKANAGVSKTLEYSYDDYSLAQLAKKLGDSANYRILMARSKNYRNMFDPSTNFMRGRLSNGDWIKNFNPQYPYYEYMYREANAWQLSFFAPHDMKGLISLYGGNDKFEVKLDSFFTVPWNPKYIARNVSSFIGQYCHGNQPDHEAPFSYYFINKPEKSQKIIDTILNSLYGIGEHGLALCGMDDAGEMSAWYVFSALGLYPFSPADTEYLATVPLFDEVKWKLDNGKKLIIQKAGNSRNLKAIKVNHKTINGYFVSHDLFKNGGTISVITE
jgi:predicted alpha-1,2-mannosidase